MHDPAHFISFAIVYHLKQIKTNRNTLNTPAVFKLWWSQHLPRSPVSLCSCWMCEYNINDSLTVHAQGTLNEAVAALSTCWGDSWPGGLSLWMSPFFLFHIPLTSFSFSVCKIKQKQVKNTDVDGFHSTILPLILPFSWQHIQAGSLLLGSLLILTSTSLVQTKHSVKLHAGTGSTFKHYTAGSTP